MAGVICPACGFLNTNDYTFCTSCGQLMDGPDGGRKTQEPTGGTQAYPYQDQHGTDDRDIERTKHGTILLIVTLLISWIPYVKDLGILFGLIGTILIILGRGAFGERHASFVIYSVVFWVIGFVAAVIGGFNFAADIISSGTPTYSTLISAFNILLGFALVGGFFISLSYVFILYELEDMLGRIAVIGGLVANIAIAVWSMAIYYPLITTAIRRTLSSTPPNLAPINNVESQITGFGPLLVLSLIPAILTTIAYAIVVRRINSGAVPAN